MEPFKIIAKKIGRIPFLSLLAACKVYLSYLYEYISEGFKIRHHDVIFLNTLLLLKKNVFQKKSACMRSNKEKTANISLIKKKSATRV